MNILNKSLSQIYSITLIFNKQFFKSQQSDQKQPYSHYEVDD